MSITVSQIKAVVQAEISQFLVDMGKADSAFVKAGNSAVTFTEKTASVDAASATLAATIADLQKQIALDGETTASAALAYDLYEGALKGTDVASGQLALSLARQVEMQEAARAATARSAAQMVAAKEAAIGFSGALLGGAGLAGIGLAAAIGALGVESFRAAVRFDSLYRALNAVSGSAANSEKQLVRLREVALLPGLGFKEAIEGAVRLEAAGISARDAADALEGFGNALATVGKGKAELDRVTLALSQMAAKGVVMGQDLRQLQEAVPQILQVMKDAFGTADTEILQHAGITFEQYIKIVNMAMKSLPKIGDTIQNDLENAADKSEQAMARIGKAITPVVSKILNDLVPAIERISEKFDKAYQAHQSDQYARSVISGEPDTESGMSIGQRIAALRLKQAEISGRSILQRLQQGGDILPRDWETRIESQIELLKKQRDVLADEDFWKRMTARVELNLNKMDAIAMAARKKSQEEAEAARQKALEATAKVDDEIYALTHTKYENDRHGAENAYRDQVADGVKQSKAAHDLALNLKVIDDQQWQDLTEINRKWQNEQNKIVAAGVKEQHRLREEAAREAKRLAEDNQRALFEVYKEANQKFIDQTDALYKTNADATANALTPDLSNRLRNPSAPAAARLNPDLGYLLNQGAGSGTPIGPRQTQQDAIEEFYSSFLVASRQHGRQIVRAILGGGDRKQLFREFLGDLQNALADTIAKRGHELIKPLFDSIGDQLKDAVTKAMKVMEVSIKGVLAAVYELLAVSERKKKVGVLSVLGGIAGGLLGGVGGAIAGYNVGNALDNGNVQQAVIGGATALAGGQFSKGGGGFDPMGSKPFFGGGSPGRAVSINYNGNVIVNDRADVNRVAYETARRLQLAANSRTG